MAHGNNGELERLRDAIRGRITMVEVCAKDWLEGRKEGAHAVRARCPFHEEKSGSFLIGGRDPHRAHCFGCGWSGDLFEYWQKKHGLTGHVEAVNQLASLVGLSPVQAGVAWVRPKAKTLVAARGSRRIEAGVKPKLPMLRALRPAEEVQLAELRGLSVEGVRVAARVFKRVGACEWPLFFNRRQNRWMSPCVEHFFSCGIDGEKCAPQGRFPCWVVTDESRWVAQFRRLDGELFTRREKRGAEGRTGVSALPSALPAEAAVKGFKSWSVGTATWPIGASEMGSRANVILVEGGADMLAAFHFLFYFRRLNSVAVVCMLGVGRIAEQALAFFKGKRVRIICDNDEEQTKVTKGKDGVERVQKSRPGADAAARWTEQLTEAGAAVKTFYLGDIMDGDEVVLPGLVTRDGARVKDLNEAVGCSAAVIDAVLRDAFCEWKEGFGG